MARYADINKYAEGISFEESYNNDELFENPIVVVNMETGESLCRIEELWDKSGCETYEIGKEPKLKEVAKIKTCQKQAMKELLEAKDAEDIEIISVLIELSSDGIAPAANDKKAIELYKKAKAKKGWMWYIAAAGLKRSGIKAWTKTEESDMREMGHVHNDEELAEYFGRSVGAIRNKRERMNINSGKKKDGLQRKYKS